MLRRLLATGLLVTWLLSGSQAHAATITFQSQDAQLGDSSFVVDILVTDLDESVIGFLLSFTFDSTVLALQSISEGSFLSQFGETDFDPSPVSPDFQTITNYLVSASSTTSSGILATLTFVSIAVGDGALSLLSQELGGTGFVTLDGTFLAPSLIDGQISVVAPTSVPEPSTLGLLGIGLAALARQRLRRKSQPSA